MQQYIFDQLLNNNVYDKKAAKTHTNSTIQFHKYQAPHAGAVSPARQSAPPREIY